MQQFEVTSLMRTILIIVLVYYGFRLLVRLLKPIIVRKGMEEMHRRQSQFQQGGAGKKNASKQHTGDVTIEKPNTKGGQADGDPDGEYVDFEEVKD
ncbi:MAG: hypothetical protein ACI84C_000328 [Flavobacteriales bacterium]|jgi:hypothetical protein